MICAWNFIGVLALQGNYECIASERQPHPMQGVDLGFCLTQTGFSFSQAFMPFRSVAFRLP